jgi:thiamine-monophosphate kinase
MMLSHGKLDALRQPTSLQESHQNRFMNTRENDLIRRIQTAASTSKTQRSASVRVGIGDDAALLASPAGRETILTCDWFLEGNHFLRDKHPADSVGWKCLARAVSDIAAMGGEPRCFLLSLALPLSHTGRWLDQFLAGLRRAAKKFRCPLAGGDTTNRNEILIHVTVVGEVRSGRALLRSAARPGDIIYVSGLLGQADLGLSVLRDCRRIRTGDPLLRKHLYPEPRIGLGRWLAEHRLATAMMDLSDGLSTDLPRLCRASGVGARLESAKIPAVRVPRWNAASNLRAASIDPLTLALNGGDDYELLFTVRPDTAHRLPSIFRGISLTGIGEITRERRLKLRHPNGRETNLRTAGWDPFQQK